MTRLRLWCALVHRRRWRWYQDVHLGVTARFFWCPTCDAVRVEEV